MMMDQKLNDSEEARLRLLEELEGRKENRAENGAQEQSGGEKRRSAFGHINSFGNNNNASLHTPGKLLQDSEATPHKSRLPCSSPRADELYGSAAASEIQRLKDQLERQRKLQQIFFLYTHYSQNVNACCTSAHNHSHIRTQNSGRRFR